MFRLRRGVAAVLAAVLLVLAVPGAAVAGVAPDSTVKMSSTTGGVAGVWSFKWDGSNDPTGHVVVDGSYGLPCCGNGAGWVVQFRLVAECDLGGYVEDFIDELPTQNAFTFYFDGGARLDAHICGDAAGGPATYVRVDFRTYCVVVCDATSYIPILDEGTARCPWDGHSPSGDQGCNVGQNVGDSVTFQGALGPWGSYGWGQAVADTTKTCGTLKEANCHRVVTFHAEIPAGDCSGPAPIDLSGNLGDSVASVPAGLVLKIDNGGYPPQTVDGSTSAMPFVGSGITQADLTDTQYVQPTENWAAQNAQSQWPLATATDTTISADFLVDIAAWDGVDGPWKQHSADLYCRKETTQLRDGATFPQCDNPVDTPKATTSVMVCWEGERGGWSPSYDFLATTTFSYVDAPAAVAGCGFSVSNPSTWGDAAQCQAVVELQGIKAELGGVAFNTGTNGSGGGASGGGGSSGPPPSSDGTNWWDVMKSLLQGVADFLKGMTDLAKSLFVPSQSSLDAIGTLRTDFSTKPPGSLLTAGSTAVQSIADGMGSACSSMPAVDFSAVPGLGGQSIAIPSLCGGASVVGGRGAALWQGAYDLVTLAIYGFMAFGLWRMAAGAFGAKGAD